MVGRLVEQEHVRLLEEEPAQGHAPDLAARESGDVGIAGRTAQRVHGDLDRSVEVPSVGGLDGVLHARLLAQELVQVVGVQGLAELGVDLVEAGEEPAHLAHAVVHVAAHVLGGIEMRLLGQVADTHAVGGMRLAEEIRVHPRHDAEQGALACAVGAEEADLGSRIERQPDALQDLPLGGNDLAEVLHEVDELMGHRPCIIPGGARFSLTNRPTPL